MWGRGCTGCPSLPAAPQGTGGPNSSSSSFRFNLKISSVGGSLCFPGLGSMHPPFVHMHPLQ